MHSFESVTTWYSVCTLYLQENTESNVETDFFNVNQAPL